MGNYTYQELRKRTQYLRGESDYTTSTNNTTIDDHIIYSLQEVYRAFPFSWCLKSTTGSIAGAGFPYTFNLAADYNPKWGILDARIISGNQGGDNIFTRVAIQDQNTFTGSDYVYFITYSTSSNTSVFNTLTTSGTVTYFYYSLPASPVNDGDIIAVPDGEAVAYLAASKMWIGDERNTELQQNYSQEAAKRIQDMYEADNAFGAVNTEGNPVDLNVWMRGG